MNSYKTPLAPSPIDLTSQQTFLPGREIEEGPERETVKGEREGGTGGTRKREENDEGVSGERTDERSMRSPGTRREYEIFRREGPNMYDIWQGGVAWGWEKKEEQG